MALDAQDLSIIHQNSGLVSSNNNYLAAPQMLQSTDERLASLAARDNTVIDNPYQSSHINQNWTRDSLQIHALENHAGSHKSSSIHIAK